MNNIHRRRGPQRHRILFDRTTVVFIILILGSSTFSFATEDQAQSHTIDQETLLWWLPPDTETVVTARGPFTIPLPKETEGQSWPKSRASSSDIQAELEQLTMEVFYGLEIAKPLRDNTVLIAMQGSRHFRDPLPGFEVMDFEGCSILVFERDLNQRGVARLQSLAQNATRREIIAGIPVHIFHKKEGIAEWDLLLAVPRPNVVIAANNLQYMREVLERIAERKSPRALPPNLLEWQFLDPTVRFWALRHYDRDQASHDATSPLNVPKYHAFAADETFSTGDPQAIGIVYMLDRNNEKRIISTYLSGNEAKIRESAAKGTVKIEPQEGVKFEEKRQSPKPGVLQRIYTLDHSSALDYVVLLEQIALGRGMYF